MALNASLIYFPHFSVTDKVQETLQTGIDKLRAWADVTVKAIEEGGFDSVDDKLMAQALAELGDAKRGEAIWDGHGRGDRPHFRHDGQQDHQGGQDGAEGGQVPGSGGRSYEQAAIDGLHHCVGDGCHQGDDLNRGKGMPRG